MLCPLSLLQRQSSAAATAQRGKLYMCTAAYLALFGMQDVKAAQRAQRKRLLSEEAGLRIRRGMIRYLVVSAVLLGVP